MRRTKVAESSWDKVINYDKETLKKWSLKLNIKIQALKRKYSLREHGVAWNIYNKHHISAVNF